MPRIEETIFAPPLEGGEWIQHGPVTLSELRGKAAVLIDFWDYTCVNCIRTLPYVTEWHRRYANDGLRIVGVHAPGFSFARKGENVREARKFNRELYLKIVLPLAKKQASAERDRHAALDGERGDVRVVDDVLHACSCRAAWRLRSPRRVSFSTRTRR